MGEPEHQDKLVGIDKGGPERRAQRPSRAPGGSGTSAHGMGPPAKTCLVTPRARSPRTRRREHQQAAAVAAGHGVVAHDRGRGFARGSFAVTWLHKAPRRRFARALWGGCGSGVGFADRVASLLAVWGAVLSPGVCSGGCGPCCCLLYVTLRGFIPVASIGGIVQATRCGYSAE